MFSGRTATVSANVNFIGQARGVNLRATSQKVHTGKTRVFNVTVEDETGCLILIGYIILTDLNDKEK